MHVRFPLFWSLALRTWFPQSHSLMLSSLLVETEKMEVAYVCLLSVTCWYSVDNGLLHTSATSLPRDLVHTLSLSLLSDLKGIIAGFHQNVLEGWDTSHWEPGLNVSSNSFISIVTRVAGSWNLSSGSIYTALANDTPQSLRAFLFRGILLVFMSSSSHIYNIKQ